MLNGIWAGMIVAAIMFGAVTGRLDAVAKAITDSAGQAVTLAIGLVGVMTFFLGAMRILEKGGLLRIVARALRPIMRLLFPDVPDDHPALGMMIMNYVSNMLGLANAATPFGLKAMIELDRLNERPGTATNAMVMFLAINTSNLALLPTGIISLRVSLGSKSPAAIFLTTLISSMFAHAAAILAAWLLSRLPRYQLAPITGAAVRGPTSSSEAEIADTKAAQAAIEFAPPKPEPWLHWIAWITVTAVVVSIVYGLWRQANGVGSGAVGATPVGWTGALRAAVREWPLLLLVAVFLLFGLVKGVKVYDAVVEGGKEGFQVAIRIIPFLVAMLVAIGMLRASGGLDVLVKLLNPMTSLLGMPAETLPMALMRPLSGNGAYGVAGEIKNTYGPDSLIGNIVSTMQGSSETTFYVLALYFGSVRVSRTRHAVPAGLTADVVGMLAAVWTCRLLLT
jgi:spore maturation protein SpmA